MPKNLLTRAALAAAATACLASAACQAPATTDSATPQPSDAIASASGAPSASTAATPTPAATPSGPRTPSHLATNLDAITVQGGKMEPPKVSFAAPWAIGATQTKVLVEGDGPVIADTATVKVLYWGVNGADGVNFDENYTTGQQATFPLSGVVPGFKKGIAGQKAGSRILIGMPGSDGYDASGGSQQAGIQVGDSLIFVVDLVAASLDAPVGQAQKQDPADPQVSDDLANPIITIPAGWTAPKDVVAKPIVKGGGATVKATDAVLVNYRGVSAKTGQVIEESYGREPETAPLAQMVDGWKKGLEGQNVGSRVLIVMPPAHAYGSAGNSPSPAVGPDDTLIYVVDILFIATP